MDKLADASEAGELNLTAQTSRPASASALPLRIAIAANVLTFFAIFISILEMNHGTFVYSLDDPYIHLALSDQIRHGHYGINATENSAPSSSIAFPFLLALASGTPLHPYLPLVMNLLAAIVSVWILDCFFTQLKIFPDSRFGIIARAIALYLLPLCANIVGVAFTGLEHNLHILTTMVCVYGAVLFLESGAIAWWLPFAVVLNPLIRYEGLALSFGVILVFALRKSWRMALVCTALILLFAGAFSLFLLHLGLSALPSSILVKTAVSSQGVSNHGSSLLSSLTGNAVEVLHLGIGKLLYLLLGIGLIYGFKDSLKWPWRWSNRALAVFLLLCLVGGHILGGHIGWLFRYEDYVLAGTVMLYAYLFKKWIASLFRHADRLTFSLAVALAICVLLRDYPLNTFNTRWASGEVYRQQFQMHRFVSDYWRAPVAVNDLGLVSYRNPNYVLDLWGLGSEEARKLKAGNAGPDAYRNQLDRAHVHFAMIYDEWFSGRVPGSWVKVATMNLVSHRAWAVAFTDVQFYATDPQSANALQPELAAFSSTLPQGAKLTIYPPASRAVTIDSSKAR